MKPGIIRENLWLVLRSVLWFRAATLVLGTTHHHIVVLIDEGVVGVAVENR